MVPLKAEQRTSLVLLVTPLGDHVHHQGIQHTLQLFYLDTSASPSLVFCILEAQVPHLTLSLYSTAISSTSPTNLSNT